jgi:hypothetical protein
MNDYSRSIDIRIHGIRQDYLDNAMRIGGVASEDNTSDILTKNLQPISTKNTVYTYISRNNESEKTAHTMSYDLPQGGRRNSGAAVGRRINSTLVRINATRRRCQHKSLASFHVHSKWSQTPLNRTKRWYTRWIFLTLECAGNWYHLSMAKMANSSNNLKSRSMLRLGCKIPAGRTKFGGTRGMRDIYPTQTSDNKVVTTKDHHQISPKNTTTIYYTHTQSHKNKPPNKTTKPMTT